MLFVLFLGVFASENTDLTANVGFGTTSKRGFDWSYTITNPDLTDPVGKIYWMLTDDGVDVTVDDLVTQNTAKKRPDPGCIGQHIQEDEHIHDARIDCSMVPNTKYLFWVAVDYNGDGTQGIIVTPGGQEVVPQEDKDCGGVWSSCNSDCIQEYAITQYPQGDGAGCEIGDEEERNCSPGTDDCPLSATYDPTNPTPTGFDLSVTPDASATVNQGVFYFIVTPPGASPTADEVKTGTGALCGGEIGISALTQITETTHCPLAPNTYEVWVSEDPQGDGRPVLITPVKTITIPVTPPTSTIFAFDPKTTGYNLGYDIDNPNTGGKFYYITVPTGTVPTMDQVRSCTTTLDASKCCGNRPQTDPSPMTTIPIDCPLTAGQTFDVYAVVDSDGNGADQSLAKNNGETKISITVPAAAQPVASVAAHSPTPTGYKLGYDVVNPTGNGKFYYTTIPDGSPDPTADTVRSCVPATGTTCCGNAQQAVPNPLTTVDVNCPLEPGKTYKVFTVVDTDGNGGQQNLGGPTVFTFDQVTNPTATLVAHTPTATGYSLSYDVSNPNPNGKFFYMTTQNGVTPTPDQIRNCQGGLGVTCCGNIQQPATHMPITSTQVGCPLAPGDTVTVWGLVDTDGNGANAAVANDGTSFPLTYTGGATPTTNVVAHTPTSTGYTLNYDIQNPIENGKFYFITVPAGTAQPSLEDIRNCVTSLGNYCCGSSNQPVPAPVSTLAVNCPLTSGQNYDVWAEVDSDGNGQNAAYGNGGAPFNLVYGNVPAPSTTMIAHTPTSAGYKLNYDVDNPREGGKFYYKTYPAGSTATLEDIRNCAGQTQQCCGSRDTTVPDPGMQSIDIQCPLTPGSNYEVWGEVDEDGNGTGASLANGGAATAFSFQTSGNPTATILVHTPSTTGFQLSYDVDNPNTNGKVYYVIRPQTTPNMDLAGVRNCDTTLDKTKCCGAIQQTNPMPMNTITVNCPLTAGTYEVYAETDTDGYGGNAALAGGSPFILTISDSGSSGSSNPPVSTSSPGTGLGTFRVVYPHEYCEGDEISDGASRTQDIILLSMMVTSVAQCAGLVSTNRANNGGCSTLFHTGLYNHCACVRLGYVCDRDESETGLSIYQLCLTTATCNQVVIFPDLQKNQKHHLQRSLPATEKTNSTPTWQLALLMAGAILFGGSVGAFLYFAKCNRHETDLEIALDSRI